MKSRIGQSYVISSISIVLILVLLGFFSILVLNLSEMSISARENVTITIVIQPKTKQSDIEFFHKKLILQPFCKSSRIVSPDEAMDLIIEDLQMDFRKVLDTNPLPTTIVLNPKYQYSSTDSIRSIVAKLKKVKFVDEVYYNETFISQLEKNIRKITLIFILLEAILIVMAFSLIHNTIRMNIHSKRSEIKTMQLVGASDWFAMRQFLFNALFQGFFSSLVAIALIVAVILSYQNATEDVVKIEYLLESFIIVMFSGILLSIVATYLSVRYYLRRDLDEII